jgi:hypothetical protein
MCSFARWDCSLVELGAISVSTRRTGKRALRVFGILTGLFVLAAGGFSATSSYTTNFPLNENPISEGGIWNHFDSTLTKVRTETIGGVHVAHGTQTGSGFYDDSSAYLSGFTLDQSIEATVWKASGSASSPIQEIELLLRWSDQNAPHSTPYGSTSAEGYEINTNQFGGYLNIGRFKGALLAQTSLGGAPKTGDKFRAQIVTNGNGSATISVFWNNVLKLTYTDNSPYTKGNPGIGFYILDSSTPNNQFGYSSITATSLGSAVPTAPAPPTNVRIK